ncbi:hypothetical protein C408_1407 [Vibrio diabolicus E0666]|uniref:hypothetical protein n=1 Tax=Vibrio diabolicus TaxID=50719 RepID=UPI0002B6FD47|nr:hypothetical protein [Vibrio diabolicus]EMD80191.1 hypothetical protein C408_1407 [Vibrio diabolicus E0666]
MFIYKIKTNKNELKKAKGLCAEDTDLKSDFFLLTDNLDLFRKIIKTKFNTTELLTELYSDSVYEEQITLEELKSFEKPIFENIFCNQDFRIEEKEFKKHRSVINQFSIMLTHLIVEKIQKNETEDWSNIGTYPTEYLEDVYQDLLDYDHDYKLCFDSEEMLSKITGFKKKIYANELYDFDDMPDKYSYERCFKCNSENYNVAVNEESEQNDPFFIHTCDKCSSRWEVSHKHNLIYFYGNDNEKISL